LASFSSQAKEKRKNHRKDKNAEKGNLPFFFRVYIWDEALLLLSPLHLPQALCLMSPQARELY